MSYLEFDFKENPYGAKDRMKMIIDQFFKAYVFLNEELVKAQLVQTGHALTHIGATQKTPVVDITMEFTGDECKFIVDALRKEFNRRY